MQMQLQYAKATGLQLQHPQLYEAFIRHAAMDTHSWTPGFRTVMLVSEASKKRIEKSGAPSGYAFRSFVESEAMLLAAFVDILQHPAKHCKALQSWRNKYFWTRLTTFASIT
jgi:hypothetical protein